MITGAQAIISSLENYGIRYIFGYPGGCIMPLYDALIGANLRHVLCRHEQAAALAADGYARASGQLGVCVATSGPGATNLVTGVANAYMDSVPLLVLSGQVPSQLIGTDAFQETDILGMTMGIVKHSYLVNDVNQLPAIMEQAIKLATSGRPGPVWIDLPKDILLQPIVQPLQLPNTSPEDTGQIVDHEQIQLARELMSKATKPLIYSGGGVMAAEAVESFRHFAKTTRFPQVQTLKGIGNAGIQQQLSLGMLGMHGSRAANEAVAECDLLIAVGVRFDDRATGKPESFAPNAKIIHLDADRSEFHKLKRADCYLRGNLDEMLKAITPEHLATDVNDWQQYCRELKADKSFHPTPNPDEEAPIDGPEFLSLLSDIKPDHCIICSDVGQHQMWVAQYMAFSHPRNHLSSGGLGTMGFGLPAAIGAQFANPKQAIVNVTGDGSFMMNLQELATIKRYQLPVKIIILDNQRLGMVRQQQELFYGERYSEIDLSDNPEFVDVSRAFGIHALKIDARHQMRRAIETMFAYRGSMLLHVKICEETNVWPIVKPGAGNHEMIDPFLITNGQLSGTATSAANNELKR